MAEKGEAPGSNHAIDHREKALVGNKVRGNGGLVLLSSVLKQISKIVPERKTILSNQAVFHCNDCRLGKGPAQSQ